MRRTLTVASVLFVLAVSAPAAAKMRADTVEWSIGKERFSGILVYDDEDDAKRPGLVMVPNWRGVNESAVDKARRIAGDDYVVLVADVYGKDVRPKDNGEAGKAAGALRQDPPRLRERALKAVEVLKAQAGKAPVDPARIGAVGFCFGGTTVLELARAGAPLDGIVSLHGGLGTSLPAAAGADTVEAPVLVLNGAADKSVGQDDIVAFGKEMDAAGADWQFVNFGGAVHCFAEADAGSDPASNCRYDARAARRAYRMLDDFFEERFGD
jgi:dienelactone hydrolase